MVYSVKDILLELNILHLFILKDNVLSNALHGIKLSSPSPLDKEYFSECTLTNHLLDLKVLQVSCFLVTGKGCARTSDH